MNPLQRIESLEKRMKALEQYEKMFQTAHVSFLEHEKSLAERNESQPKGENQHDSSMVADSAIGANGLTTGTSAN